MHTRTHVFNSDDVILCFVLLIKYQQKWSETFNISVELFFNLQQEAKSAVENFCHILPSQYSSEVSFYSHTQTSIVIIFTVHGVLCTNNENCCSFC